jgi:transcriptional regulator with XRE-family HTH domain
VARSEQERRAIGARIRDLHLRSGLKQKTAVQRLHVSARTYEAWLAGSSVPEEGNLAHLAELFGVTPEYILAGEAPEPDLRAQFEKLRSEVERSTARAQLAESVETEERALVVMDELQDIGVQLRAIRRIEESQRDLVAELRRVHDAQEATARRVIHIEEAANAILNLLETLVAETAGQQLSIARKRPARNHHQAG